MKTILMAALILASLWTILWVWAMTAGESPRAAAATATPSAWVVGIIVGTLIGLTIGMSTGGRSIGQDW